MVLVVSLGVALTVFEFHELDIMESKLSELRGIINEQDETIKALGDEKNELESLNQVLNNTVAMARAEKEQSEREYEERHIPSGFPLTGAAVIADISVMDEPEEEQAGYFNYDVGNKYNTSTGKKAVEENPIIVFEMSTSSDVVATAEGRVVEVSEDEIFTRRVKIDHGNGYYTIYRNKADAKVSVGSEVVRGTIIFVGGEDNKYLGYQVMDDEEYIDPMQVIAIDG